MKHRLASQLRDEARILRTTNAEYAGTAYEDRYEDAMRAMNQAADLIAVLHERFVVIGAPGWPSGHAPTPNTLEAARDFRRRHGGRIRRQYASPWEDVE